jgi:hypothetical protein
VISSTQLLSCRFRALFGPARCRLFALDAGESNNRAETLVIVLHEFGEFFRRAAAR